MFKNYIKIAWRNIVKNPFYSLVNIIGLSAGIAFAILIAAYVWSEMRVNKELKNAGRQYILQSRWKDPNQGLELTTLGPLAKELKDRYPDLVANYYRWDGVTSSVANGNKAFREGIQICDSTMLNMYGFKLKYGNPATAFEGPYSVVITTDRAIKYFGKQDVLGKTLTIESFSGSKHDFIITGVLIKPSRNSATWLTDDNDNQVYISSNNISYFGRNMSWPNQYIVGFIELQKGVTPKDLEQPIQHLVKQNAAAGVAENMTPYLMPLKEYYLSSNNGLVKKMLFALSAIAFFILLMAVINFVNMSISRSATRMREIGIRKVLGGLKKQLILQFLIESIILVLLATLLSMFIYIGTKDLFSTILSKEIPALTRFPLYFVVFPVLLIIIVGTVAGIYPAFVLSSLKSVESLKGKLTSVKENVLLRKSLVGFQFGTATVVFTGAIIISQQINLFFSKDIGFNKDYIVSVQVPRNWTPEGVRKMETIRQEFAGMKQVSQATLSFEVPDGNSSGNIALYKAGADSISAITFTPLTTDEHYAAAYSIPMSAGTFFNNPGGSIDSTKLVLNESGAKALGWAIPGDAVGRQLRFPGSPTLFTVAGITKDFHFGSMQKTISPVAFLHVKLGTIFRVFSFKLKPGNIGNDIAALQNKWSALMPGTPFEYKFMDDTLSKLYKSEIQLKKAAYTATALSGIIVFLGVLGLISLSVQKRTKEIGIRKVLGSSVNAIVILFMKEFLWIILIAGTVACPVAYLLMQRWLNAYVYRINITALPFATATISLGIITASLILIQTIKTALANPVKSLRTE